ncbi:MAG: DUF2924 domain-containing protein [Phycisphaerales bacterium]
MTVPQLRQRYAEVFGEPTRTKSRVHLIKRIAWRTQALREGDLSERARRRGQSPQGWCARPSTDSPSLHPSEGLRACWPGHW